MSNRHGWWLRSFAFAVLACRYETRPPATATMPVAAPKATSGPATTAPLLDRALFFADAETSAPQLSPDGERIAFVRPHRGVANVWVKRRDEPLSAARPITTDPRPVSSYFWSYDGRHVLYVQDKDGDENLRVYAVDASSPVDPSTGVPPARSLTPGTGVRAWIVETIRKQPGIIVAGLNDRDPAFHDLYAIEVATGKRTLLHRNTARLTGYVLDDEGNLRLGSRTAADGAHEILRIAGKKLTPIHRCDATETCRPLGFHADGKRVYMTTNAGDADRMELVLVDVATGAIQKVEADPEGHVDFHSAEFAEETGELIATVYVGDRRRTYPRDPAYAADLARMREAAGEGELTRISSSVDMRFHLYELTRDVNPGSVYVYDRRTGDVEKLYDSRPDLPTDALARVDPFVYRARDGLEIHAYLTVPNGVPAAKLPLVLLPHGGPNARDSWGYAEWPQFLANRGYAVLQPNFRGSEGYGERFLAAGNRQWGTGAMQHDLTDGVKHLIARGIVDAARVAIFGGSYGGYATLAGVAFTPDLYAAGISVAGPSNLLSFLESFPPQWQPFVASSWYPRLGDPSKPADREDLRHRSPLFAVDRIRAPLLVIHGANDPRVRQAEADAIVAALRDKGQPVEYLLAKDEGHGFHAPLSNMAMAVAIERFLAKHLGGRAQEEVPPEVQRRLDELRVDVESVTAPPRAVSTSQPAPGP